MYDILRRYDNGQAAKRKHGSGCNAKIFTPKNLVRLEEMFENNDQISYRTAALKFGASWSGTRKALLTKTSIRYRHKKKIPHRNDEQKALAKTKCGRLIRKFPNLAFIEDDESYFTLSHSTVAGNDGYYTSDVSAAPPSVKFTTKKKFESKVLVWIAIGPAGVSKPLIRKSGLSINAERYLDLCIKRRLVPYIHENYQEGEYIFWPDQASSHYAKIVLAYLNEEKINFVGKDDNPASVPEIRVIENFWGYLKSLVYAKGWKAKNCEQLITRIKYCLKKIDNDVVQKLVRSTKSRIDTVRRYGVIENR